MRGCQCCRGVESYWLWLVLLLAVAPIPCLCRRLEAVDGPSADWQARACAYKCPPCFPVSRCRPAAAGTSIHSWWETERISIVREQHRAPGSLTQEGVARVARAEGTSCSHFGPRISEWAHVGTSTFVHHLYCSFTSAQCRSRSFLF